MLSPPSASKLRLTAFIVVLLFAMWTMLRLGFVFYRTEEWNTPAPMVIFVLCEIPLLLSLFSIAVGNDKSIAIGTGIAFGSALLLTFCIPVLWLAAAFTPPFRSHSYPHLESFRLALGPTLAVLVCVIVSAWFSRRENRTFWLAAAFGAGYLIVAIQVGYGLAIPGSGQAKTNQYEVLLRQSSRTYGAPQMRALTACLIAHNTQHPENGFPDSLEQIKNNWGCDAQLASPTAIRGYWLSYWPVRDAGTARATDFRLQAISTDGVPYSVLMSDKRGFLFESKSPVRNLPPKLVPPGAMYLDTLQSGCWGIRMIQNAVSHYQQKNFAHILPRSIQDALTDGDRRSFTYDPKVPNDLYFDSVADDGTRHPNALRARYQPPAERTAGEFTASTQCLSYGKDCIVSCYLDAFGSVHSTGEPRSATDEDPVTSRCELEESCSDDVWSIAAQPSEAARAKANALYLLHTTSWW
jgi:hypothetical protein